MRKRVVLVTLVFIFVLSMFPLHQGMSGGSPGTTMSVEPQGSYGLILGQTFSVNITVSNVTDCYGWEFYLYYQSAVLNGTQIGEGTFLGTPGTGATFFLISAFTDNYNATFGYMYVGCTLIGNVSGVSGSGTLATLTFTTVGTGDSVLHLEDTGLYDSATPFHHYIPHASIDGEAFVGSVDIAITTMDVPTDIPQGSMQYINVTVQNRGQIPESFDVTLTYNGTVVGPGGVNTVLNLQGGDGIIVNFTWDTSSLPMGVYNLTATATNVPGEGNPDDLTLSVLIQLGIRDLTIALTPRTIVAQGYTVTYNVTLKNLGQMTETTNVTLYIDSDAVLNQTDALASGAQETIRFTWNTTAVTFGNHNITAYVWPVPFEMNTTNNNSTLTVHVGVPGDVSSSVPGVPDKIVNMKDIAYLVVFFNSRPGYPNWNPNADINDDGVVNMRDIAISILYFNQHE